MSNHNRSAYQIMMAPQRPGGVCSSPDYRCKSRGHSLLQPHVLHVNVLASRPSCVAQCYPDEEDETLTRLPQPELVSVVRSTSQCIRCCNSTRSVLVQPLDHTSRHVDQYCCRAPVRAVMCTLIWLAQLLAASLLGIAPRSLQSTVKCLRQRSWPSTALLRRLWRGDVQFTAPAPRRHCLNGAVDATCDLSQHAGSNVSPETVAGSAMLPATVLTYGSGSAIQLKLRRGGRGSRWYHASCSILALLVILFSVTVYGMASVLTIVSMRARSDRTRCCAVITGSSVDHKPKHILLTSLPFRGHLNPVARCVDIMTQTACSNCRPRLTLGAFLCCIDWHLN